jgi:hypothetical protein
MVKSKLFHAQQNASESAFEAGHDGVQDRPIGQVRDEQSITKDFFSTSNSYRSCCL